MMTKNADIFLTMAGVYLVASSVCAVIGRITGVRWLYDWGDGVGMAYTTAFNFVACGVAFLALANKISVGKRKSHDKLNPIS